MLLERPGALYTPHLTPAAADEKQRDLKLLETAPPEGQAKQLIPKALDADDEDPDESESSSDDDDVSPTVVDRSPQHPGHPSSNALTLPLDLCAPPTA